MTTKEQKIDSFIEMLNNVNILESVAKKILSQIDTEYILTTILNDIDIETVESWIGEKI